jgi:hypothetical protein
MRVTTRPVKDFIRPVGSECRPVHFLVVLLVWNAILFIFLHVLLV